METCLSVNHEPTDVKDPFSQWSTFSLLSKTLRSSNKSMELDHQELDPLQNLLSSMESEDQMKLIEQATTVLNSNSDFPNYDFTSQNLPNDQDNTFVNQPKRQRPDLGRKRARFSLMPSKSQPVTLADPKTVLENLEDPEEYFAALERIELADKEKKRLKGETGGEPSQPPRERIHRPGLNLRRKPLYKHVYPKFSSNAENFDPSFGSKSEVKVLSPSKATSNLVSEATEMPAGSRERDTHDEQLDDGLGKGLRVETVKRSGSSFSEMLNACRDLDESQTFKLLQERLGFQSLVLDKQNIPELDRAPTHGYKALQDVMQSPNRASSIVHPLTESANTQEMLSERRKNVENLISPRTSSRVRSPLSLVSALQGRISEIVSETDPVSLHNTATGTSRGHFSSEKGLHKTPSPPVCMDKTLTESANTQEMLSERWKNVENLISPRTSSRVRSPLSPVSALQGHISEIVSETDPVSLHNTAAGTSHGHFSSEKGLHKTPSPPVCMDKTCDGGLSPKSPRPLTSINASRLSSSFHLKAPDEGTKEIALSRSIDSTNASTGSIGHVKPTPSMNGNTVSFNNRLQTSGNETGSIRNSDFDSETLVRQQSSCQVDVLTGDNSIESEKASDKGLEGLVSEEPVQAFTTESVHEGGSQLEKPKSTPTCLPMDENVEKSNLVPEQSTQEIQMPPSTPGRRTRRKVQSRKQSKIGRRPRFSLAGAGTSWEGGLRRSTRVKSKPLQWWKGERLLYGRLHNSLATVIGAKYVTSNDDKKEREFEVVSFVSNDYENLVEQVARH
ncbi:centromere protein C [Aristolochia californica]|uniref:centromere protein C n=1 Tax=Aristolochia californica TaxID=171875 RepID=UPI0035D5B886